jgi:hypothetical protein
MGVENFQMGTRERARDVCDGAESWTYVEVVRMKHCGGIKKLNEDVSGGNN